ncbi:RES family NAD+ phosphorylase [Rhodopseudomonas sp. HC1]|uniref:RES family NAD+ phosphorylase n=1 Tax=Rhodopseudomonas infernalis TaxID=2897386 RepID=UPI001EE868CA|nr:RES family NAD+ phosphorylase [Rhodopseudomonas infernalis]MCG6205716.1 RES family NAD+ phosphorylase [Rhodopseudomonas infernalis]
MSSSTWIRDALRSEQARLSGRFWRIVEAQHQSATMKLTDSLEEQALLEEIVEETKPPIPPDCDGLDFLLMTPFRYSAMNPWGSRFRRPNAEAGVFYASAHPSTAIAEAVFHRLTFFAESPGTPWPQNPAEYTAFAVELTSERALDLTVRPPHDIATIMSLQNYAAGQAFSEAARADGGKIIKYPSVRDPQGGANVAVLTPHAFGARAPVERQSWRIHLDRNGARAFCEAPRSSLAFGRTAFNADPRMSGLVWDR